MRLLSERFAQELYLDDGTDALVENVIDGIEDGHVDVQVLVDVLHALGGKVAFGNHLHLELCTLHAVALPYHRAEDAVAAEVGVARDEQVARIDALRDAAVDGIDGIEEAFHLLDGVADEHGLEVVAVLQSVADAGGDGVNVLQDRGILDADDVATGLCLDVVTGKHLRKSGSLLLVSTTDGQVSEAVQGDLLGMTRSLYIWLK